MRGESENIVGNKNRDVFKASAKEIESIEINKNIPCFSREVSDNVLRTNNDTDKKVTGISSSNHTNDTRLKPIGKKQS